MQPKEKDIQPDQAAEDTTPRAYTHFQRMVILSIIIVMAIVAVAPIVAGL